jgi:hypothetical protein
MTIDLHFGRNISILDLPDEIENNLNFIFKSFSTFMKFVVSLRAVHEYDAEEYDKDLRSAFDEFIKVSNIFKNRKIRFRIKKLVKNYYEPKLPIYSDRNDFLDIFTLQPLVREILKNCLDGFWVLNPRLIFEGNLKEMRNSH